MKNVSIKYKTFAIVLTLSFTLQSLPEINEHAYTTGIDSFHYDCGCFGCWPTHLSQSCESEDVIHIM